MTYEQEIERANWIKKDMEEHDSYYDINTTAFLDWYNEEFSFDFSRMSIVYNIVNYAFDNFFLGSEQVNFICSLIDEVSEEEVLDFMEFSIPFN